jgi:hypothetical protein
VARRWVASSTGLTCTHDSRDGSPILLVAQHTLDVEISQLGQSLRLLTQMRIVSVHSPPHFLEHSRAIQTAGCQVAQLG